MTPETPAAPATRSAAPKPAPRGGFAHPLAAADLASARAALARGGASTLGHLPLLAAAAFGGFRRRAWIARTAAAAADVPDDWHLAQPPLFIVGFWRSGTTLLHELMACDKSFAAPSLLDVLCPADAPFLLGRKRELVAKTLPASRGFDAVEIAPTRPQEEEWALAQLGAPSFFNAFYFPRARARLIDEALFFEGEGNPRRAWSAAHGRFLKTLRVKHPTRAPLLKNPANSTRIAELAALYPTARFLRIDRDRDETLRSLRRMMDGMAGMFSLQGAVPAFTAAEAESLHDRVTDRLDADWRALPPERALGLRYERLTARPLATVAEVYEGFGLDLTREARTRQKRFWELSGKSRRPYAGPR
jgi:hypothetical protein